MIYRGADGHLHELYWESAGGWHRNDLTNASGGAPAVAGDPAGYVLGDTQHVIYRGDDGHLHELYWESAGGWHRNDLTNASGGAPAVASDPFAFVYNNESHVAYRDPAGIIWDSWYDGAGNWNLQQINLSGLTAGPAAAGSFLIRLQQRITCCLPRHCRNHLGFVVRRGG